MKTISSQDITKAVAELCKKANYFLPEDTMKTLEESLIKEKSPLGKDIIGQIIKNARIAAEEQIPICQDTGFAVFFVELGQDVKITDGFLYDAINEGVRIGYTEGYLRKSIIRDPLERINTGDNTPAVIHLKLTPGEKLKITLAPKGGGSENMSKIKMLKPSEGIEGVKNFVLDSVLEAGPNPCPPIIVGVGIGGTFEKAALLAKEALLRPLGWRNPIKNLAELELDLIYAINCSGIGPQGLGGLITALDVHVETYPAHIASLPVAVNINCHAHRHASVEF